MCKYRYCNRISEYRLTWGKILRYSKVVFPWCWRSMEVLPAPDMCWTVVYMSLQEQEIGENYDGPKYAKYRHVSGSPSCGAKIGGRYARDLEFDCSFTKNVFGFKNGPDRIWTCSEDANHNDLYRTMLRWALWGPCFATAEAQASYAVAGKIAVFQRRRHRGVDPTMT